MKKGLGLVLGTAVISGVSIFLNKFGVNGFDASLFTTSKNVLVALFLCCTLFALKEWRVLKDLSGKAWAQLALIGLLGGSLPFLLFFNGLKLTSAVQGAFLHKTMFVWVAVLAAFTLKERVNKRMLFGALLLLAGNFVLLKMTSWNFGVGDVLILAATFLWGGEVVLSKHVLNTVHALPGRIVAFGRMAFGSFFLLTYLAFTGKLSLYASLTSSHWLWLGVTSLFLFAYVFTFYEGLARLPASTAVTVLLLGSVVTLVLNAFWTGSIALHQFVGALFLLLGAATFVGVPSPRKVMQQARL